MRNDFTFLLTERHLRWLDCIDPGILLVNVESLLIKGSQTIREEDRDLAYLGPVSPEEVTQGYGDS